MPTDDECNKIMRALLTEEPSPLAPLDPADEEPSAVVAEVLRTIHLVLDAPVSGAYTVTELRP